MKLRALIVDDEPLARDVIRFFLAEEPDVEVIGESQNGREAVRTIRNSKPDLVFLDVQMPGWSGFDVLAEIGPATVPAILFVTAFDRYALRAFEVHAVDYLLKPIAEARLREALRRVRERLGNRALRQEAERLGRLLGSLDPTPTSSSSAIRDEAGWVERLTVKQRGKVSIVPVEELEWVEAAGDYVYLHGRRSKSLLRESLKNLESRLSPHRFLRIHRSVIINLERLQEARSIGHGEYRVVLTNGTVLKVSRSYSAGFRKALERRKL